MTSPRSASLVLTFVLAGLGFSACGSDEVSTSGDDVSGVVWQLVELGGEPVADGVTPTLEFDGTSISGSTGCNTYSGGASFDDGSVIISEQIMSTLMACEPPASDVESAFLAALPTITGFEVDGGTLLLSSDDDSTLVLSAPG